MDMQSLKDMELKLISESYIDKNKSGYIGLWTIDYDGFPAILFKDLPGHKT